MGKEYRIRLAESGLERAARMLTDDYQLKVVFKAGATPITNGSVVILPALPPDASDEHVETLTGLLFHEAGHKIFSEFPDASLRADRCRYSCINAVEDVRMEQCLRRRFVGVDSSLRQFHGYSAKVLQKNWLKATPLERVINGFYYTQTYGKGEFYEFLDPSTRAWVDGALEITGEVGELPDTAAAIDVGNKLADFLKPLFDEHKISQSNKNQQQDQQGMEDATSFGTEQDEEKFNQLMQELDQTQSEKSEDEDEGVGKADLKNLQGDGTYIIYSTELDVIEKIQDRDTVPVSRAKDAVSVHPGVLVNALRQTTADNVSVMRRRLLNTLRTLKETKWHRGLDEGELDLDVLYEIPTRLSTQVFKQRRAQPELDVCVALAIDHSGSMGTEKMTLATQCAIVLGDVLQPMQIPFLVYGFSTISKVPAGVPSEKELHQKYARWNGLWIGVYHDFKDNWRDGSQRVATAMNNQKQNTLDGESVLWGMRRLLARKERRKILFVLTDGQPEPSLGHPGRCKDHLKAVTQLAPKVGVEVVAFGIRSRSVETYYPNHVYLPDLHSIVEEPLTKLDDALRKGRRFR